MTFRIRMLAAFVVFAGLSTTIDGQNREPTGRSGAARTATAR